MNADLIQSVARVGDYVEVRLLTGDRFEGVLEELTLTRLTLRQPDGVPVAVALATVAVTLPKPDVAGSAPAPTATPPTVPGSATPIPAPIPAPIKPVPPARVPSGQEREAALAAVAALPVLPVDLDIYVIPGDRGRLEQIRNSYSYAEKIDELHVRYSRVHQLYARALELRNADQANPELARLVGALALLKEDTAAARHHLCAAADAGDVPALRLLAVTAAHLKDPQAATYALLHHFHTFSPAADPPAWEALLALLDAFHGREQLGELLRSEAHGEAGREAIRAALNGAEPSPAPMPRPPVPKPEPPLPPPKPEPPLPRRAAIAGRSSQQRGFEDPYQRAKFLEHRLKNLPGAKAAYREAIRRGVKRESAVKDLAWLTKRTEGADAALEVIERECANMVKPGDALDNILIDFLTSARRYADALEVLTRQHDRSDLTSSKRYHLCHQMAYVKLADGQDSTAQWTYLLEQSPDNPTPQRGLALALIQRGEPADLDAAERLIEQHTDERAEGIRLQITALREGGGAEVECAEWVEQLLTSAAPGLADSTPPLVTYVMNNYSELATRAREQRERENKPVTTRDLNPIAEMARQMSGKQPSDSAGAYISAAVLARELGERDAQRYLCLGLTTLADIVLDRQEHQSARDLYRAALAAADEREDSDGERDVRSALIGYLRSLNGRRAAPTRRRDRDETAPLTDEVARVLLEEQRRHGAALFTLIPPLLAETSLARNLVLDAIDSMPDLLTASSAYLNGGADGSDGTRALGVAQTVRAAWQQEGEQWSRTRRRLSHGLAELQHLTVSEDVLASALVRLQDHIDLAPEPLREALGRIKDALFELRRFINERSFEERENCLRLTVNTVRALRADIERGPTSLAVELVEPVALRVTELVNATQNQLLQTQPPQPELSLALEQSNAGQNGVVTVQIKVANAPGMAPLESPRLTIDAEPALFSVGEPEIQLPTAVRGGSHRIEAVKLQVTEEGLRTGAFSLPVELRYRPRSSEHTAYFHATLPVHLAREEEFEQIFNPFQDGATGRPVVNKEMFFGRDDLIDRIRARLRDALSPGVGVAVFGQKRAGKSSIRLHLTERLEQDDGLLVVDVGNIGDLSPEAGDLTSTRLLALLMWRILEGAAEALARRRPDAEPLIPAGLDRSRFLDSPEPIHDCARLIERYRTRSTGERALIVIIDEFQYIDQWIRNGLLSPSFMQSFKALIERRLFHLVIVGQAALNRLIETDPNVFGVFFTERVTYIAEPDARRLIEEPIWLRREPPVSRYKERAVDQILELTGGSAFYIQRFCYQLVEYMNCEHAPVVTEADVDRVRDEFLDALEAKDFDNLESPGYTDTDTSTGEQYRQVLLAVARASRNQPATMQAIREQYAGGPRLQYLLDDLVLRDVVRRESGAYRIVVRLYQDWLLKYFGATAGTA